MGFITSSNAGYTLIEIDENSFFISDSDSKV